MRRLPAIALLAGLAASAFAGGAPAPEAIRAAKKAVFSRPEFRYGTPKPKSWIEEAWDSFVEWVFGLHQAAPVLFWVVFGVMLVVLVLLIAHIVWTLRSLREAEWTPDASDSLDAAMRRGDPSPFRARAVEHAAAGRFDEAVRDLYASLLLTLDRRGVVRYASHKALLDYRLEAARDPGAARTLDLFAGTYHPGSFGRRPPDRQHFDALLAALDRIGRPAA